MKNYNKEFDMYVQQYNRWFNAPVRMKIQHPWKNVAQAVFGSEHLEHYSLGHVFESYPCFHERSDLNSSQKAAIALGSDCKRIEASLEQKLFSAEDDNTKLGILRSCSVVTEMYNLMRDIYVAETAVKSLKSQPTNSPLQVI